MYHNLDKDITGMFLILKYVQYSYNLRLCAYFQSRLNREKSAEWQIEKKKGRKNTRIFVTESRFFLPRAWPCFSTKKSISNEKKKVKLSEFPNGCIMIRTAGNTDKYMYHATLTPSPLASKRLSYIFLSKVNKDRHEGMHVFESQARIKLCLLQYRQVYAQEVVLFS